VLTIALALLMPLFMASILALFEVLILAQACGTVDSAGVGIGAGTDINKPP